VRYTAFGKVVLGLDVIDKIDVDDKILHVRVEGAR
jgi:cyclophilin family peptidyl-prolyl cis-trans isomerase